MAIVDDPMLQDGMQARWDHTRVQMHVTSMAEQLKPTLVRLSSLAPVLPQHVLFCMSTALFGPNQGFEGIK